MSYQWKCRLFLILFTGLLFILFCGDPTKSEFVPPEPFSFSVFTDSLGTDTLKTVDTLLAGTALYLGIKANRPQDIISVSIDLVNSVGDTLYDSVSTIFDTLKSLIPLGFYIPYDPGIYSLFFKAVTLDTTISVIFDLTFLGLSPVLMNNKKIQRSGVPVVDSSFFMYVLATGSDSLQYYWYKNDSLLNRADSDTLKFDTLGLSDSGVYHCKVTNDYGEDISEKDTLFICCLPVIIEMGTSGVPEKDSSFFIYVKAMGSDTLKYQWYKNDSIVTEGIDDTLNFNTLTDSDNGNTYHCVVSNKVGSVASDSYTLVLGNHPPQWIHDTLYGTVNENATFSMSLPDSCSDPDGDVLTFSLLAGSPVGDTITNINTYTFTPTYDDAGQYAVTISASDGNVSCKAVLILTVINVNRKPVFIPDTPATFYQIAEGDTLKILFNAVDPDGDSITYRIAQNSLPHPQTTVFNTSQRIITWISSTNDLGAYRIELHALDGTDTGLITINIEVGNVNLPPQIAIKGYQTGETITVKEQITLTCTVTVSDPNIQDNPVLLPVENKPPNSSYDIVDDTLGVFSYTPDFSVSNKQLDITFSNVTFYATDSTIRAIDTFIVHITVKDSNAAPQCSDITKTVEEVVAEGVNIPATDVDGDPLSWSISQDPSNGSVIINSILIGGGDEFSYTADNLVTNDSDLIKITVSDGIAQCEIEVIITIEADNDAPVITDIPDKTVEEGQTFSAIQLDNYVDDDHPDSVIIWNVTGQSQLQIDITDRVATITILDDEWNGSEIVTFTAEDPGDLTDIDEVIFTISPINDPPAITSTAPTTAIEDEEYEYTVLVNDPDDANNGVDLTWLLTSGPSGMHISNSGTITWTPLEGVTSSGLVTVVVDDSGEDGALPATQEFTITVTPVNDAPSITTTAPTTATENIEYTYDPDADDPELGTLTWSLTNAPSGMTINQSTGEISWTPGEGVLTSGEVTLTVKDNGTPQLSDTELFTVTVTPVNDSP